jgi:hypothetical protein
MTICALRKVLLERFLERQILHLEKKIKDFAPFRQFLHDKKNNSTCTNTDGWGNKLVTIFARHIDSFIVTIKLSILYQTRDFGSGQILPLDNFLVRRDGKNCAIPSSPPGQLCGPADAGYRDAGRMASSGNVYYHNRRAVMFKPEP